MMRLFAILLFLIMTANLSVSVIEQLRRSNIYELSKSNTDDSNEENKTEKVKEQESYIFSFHSTPISNIHDPLLRSSCLLGKEDRLVSEIFVSLPKRPPRGA